VKKILISLGSFFTLILPMLVMADTSPRVDSYMGNLIRQGTSLLKTTLTFLIALAVVWFIWNVIQYTISDDEEKKGKAKGQMVWGIVGIAVIVSIWGLVAILQNAFGVQQGVNSVQGDFGNMIPIVY
jgi:heme A synthase